MNNKQIFSSTCLVIAMAGLFSCKVARKYQQPELPIADSFRTISGTPFNIQDSGIATIPYKEFFTDTYLLGLIDKGIANNYDMQLAVKQIEFSEETLKQAKLGNIPTVSATLGNASIMRPSDKSLNGAFVPELLGHPYITDYTSHVDISWEADLWGKIKNRKQASIANLLKTQEGKKIVQTKLVSAIADGYYNLLLLKDQKRITQESIQLFDSTITITEAIQSVGDVNILAIEQQQAAREAAAASIPKLEAAIAIQENALSILIGEKPTAITEFSTLAETKLKEELPVGLPANIVSNRPDVHQAEYAVMESVAYENVAHANMYPSFSITAQGGVDAVDFKNWFDLPSALFGSALGNLTTPIFSGRKLKTAYNQSKNTTEQAVLTFKKTVQTSMQEVSNAMITIQKLKEQASHIDNQVEKIRSSVQNAGYLFQNGEATYLEVLSAQNNRLQAELTQSEIQRQKLSAVVMLYQALGGGWR